MDEALQTSQTLGRFAIVLVRPKSPGNIGAVARAMMNMELRELRMVEPAPFENKAGLDMAVHAHEILKGAKVHPTLADALQGITLSVGTTCRGGPYRSHAQPLRECARELVKISSANRVAIVFGPEDHGLSNEELKLCQILARIPSGSDYPSLNLAQAALIVAYELRIAVLEAAAIEAPGVERAGVSDVNTAIERLKDALVAIGFLAEENADHIMMAIREMVGRSGVAPRELDILNGIARQIGWFAEGGHATIEAKRRAGRRIR